MKNSDQSPEISFAQQTQERYRAFAREMVVRQMERYQAHQASQQTGGQERESRNNVQTNSTDQPYHSLTEISRIMNPDLQTLSGVDVSLCQGDITLERLGETTESWKRICKNADFYSLYMHHAVPEIFQGKGCRVIMSSESEEGPLQKYNKMFSVKGRMDGVRGPVFEVLSYIINRENGKVEYCVRDVHVVRLETIVIAFREAEAVAESHREYYEVAAGITEDAQREVMGMELRRLIEDRTTEGEMQEMVRERALKVAGVNTKKYQQ